MLPFAFLFATLVASLPSGFQHGYSVACLTSIKEPMLKWMGTTDYKEVKDAKYADKLFTHISSCICLGGIVGGMLSSVISKQFGRKYGLMINTFIADIAGGLLFCSIWLKWPYILIVGRVIWGVNCGLNAALCPTYLSEIAPSKFRGMITSCYQLFIVISILLAQVLTLSPIFGNDKYWNYTFILVIVMGILQFVLFFFVPESPKFILLKNDDEEKADKATSKLYGGDERYKDAFAEMKGDVALAKSQPKITVKTFFSTRIYVIPLMFGFFLMYAQQFSGINAVLFYSTQIFKKTALKDHSDIATAGIGVVNFLTTILSMWLVEKLGRKKLLAIGFIGMAIFTTLLMVSLLFQERWSWLSYTCLIWVYLFIFCFASGAGSVPWIMMSEMFDASARPIAIAMIVPSNWLFNYLVTLLFPIVEEYIGAYVFIIFIVSQILAVVVVWLFLPETKGIPVEEIVAKFKKAE